MKFDFSLSALVLAFVGCATALHQEAFTSTRWVFEDDHHDSAHLHAEANLASAGEHHHHAAAKPHPFEGHSISFIVAMKLRNGDQMQEDFLSISNPRSKHYAKYLSHEDLAQRYGPTETDTQRVVEYFHQIPGAEVEVGDFAQFLTVHAPIPAVEAHLNTKLGVVKHHTGANPSKALRAKTDMHIPDDIAQHLDFVSLNAPVNHARPRAVKSRQSVENSQAQEALPVSVTTGNEEALVRFFAICGNGQINQVSPPCTNFGDAAVPALTFTFNEYANNPSNPFKLNTDPTVFTYPGEKAYCYNDFTAQTCSGNDGRNCTCVVKISPLPKYTQLVVNVTARFPQSVEPGKTVYYGSSHYFALTDVATAGFLSELYNIPKGLRVSHGSNQSVAEFYSEFYSNTDLSKFFALSGLPNATIPSQNVFGDLPNNYSNPGGEAQLDVEYIMALAPGADTFFYSMRDYNPFDGQNHTNEGFLAYLTYVSRQTNPPLVHSLSYGDNEADVFNQSNPNAIAYANACDQAFMTLGMQGLTFLFSSGDDGIGSAIIREDPDAACQKAVPEWPASSPYVTAVGATQMTNKYLPICEQNYAPAANMPYLPQIDQLVAECTGTAETTCTSVMGGVITSGGGFSNVHNQPSWQANAVSNYLSAANSAAYPPLSYFNPNGRGYPDVATYGSNYFIYLNNKITRESGTSASAPVFAAMVTLWNDLRFAYGMPPMGFIAPFLYQIYQDHPEAFNDIVTGNNACGANAYLNSIHCCEYSFAASPGWDAVTGLGSPNFEVISNLVINPNSYFPTLGAFPDGTSTVINNDNTDDEVKAEAEIALGLGATGFVLGVLCTAFSIYFYYQLTNKKDPLLGWIYLPVQLNNTDLIEDIRTISSSQMLLESQQDEQL